MKISIISLLVFCCCTLTAADLWPDGTPVDAWFSDTTWIQGRNAAVCPDRKFDIRRFGARAGLEKLQTEAIQRAINAAARHGGTVVVPEGRFKSGALFFKPGTKLHLDRGAVLLGSDDIEDYPRMDVHIEGVIQPYPSALVNAYGVDGFSISGQGCIDGNGAGFWDAYWTRRKENPQCTNLEVLRPRMIYICRSNGVSVSGVTLKNPGFWTAHFYKCSRVRIDSLVVRAPVKPVRAASSDAIDIDACSDVHISRCDLATCDDLIALKGGKGPWGDQDPDNGINERILAEDCIFGHGPGALVLGSECIGARNVILRNSRVNGTDRLLWLKMRPDTPQNYEYILVENVEGHVKWILYVKPWTQFFDLKGRKDIPLSKASHVTVRDCNVISEQGNLVEEEPSQYQLSF